MITKAIELASVRAVIASGWCDLGVSGDSSEQSNIFLLQHDCPHDFLFRHVSLVVHHGGAGTTAAGLAAGLPTVVVPFFGDQFFWGNMVHRAGVGPAPIPHVSLNASILAEAIAIAQGTSVQTRARELGRQITDEDGVEAAVQAFHAHLPQLRCSLFHERTATWQYTVKSKSKFGLKIERKNLINLSALAATFLRKHNLIPLNALERMPTLRTKEHNVVSGPFEPVSGAAWAILDLFYDSFKGMGEILTEVGHTPYLGYKAFDKGKAALRAKPNPGQNGSLDQRDPSLISSADPSSSQNKHSYPGSFMLKGTLRLGKAAARAPGAFTSAMASGAHNLPLLYNDPTVRPTPQITGIGSGVKAGVAELGFGVYDGIVGLFTQPIMGAIHPSVSQHGSQDAIKKSQTAPKDSNSKAEDVEEPPWTAGAGALGFAKGLGRGALGLPVKFVAGKFQMLSFSCF